MKRVNKIGGPLVVGYDYPLPRLSMRIALRPSPLAQRKSTPGVLAGKSLPYPDRLKGDSYKPRGFMRILI